MFLSSGLTTALQFTGPEQINADDDDDEHISRCVNNYEQNYNKRGSLHFQCKSMCELTLREYV